MKKQIRKLALHRETLRTLDDLVRAGKIRYAGLSDVPAWYAANAQTLADAHSLTPMVSLQLPYSLIERTIEAEHVPAAQALGLGITAWSPLGGGFLTGKYREDGQSLSGQGLSGEGRLAIAGTSATTWTDSTAPHARPLTVHATTAATANLDQDCGPRRRLYIQAVTATPAQICRNASARRCRP